MKKAKTTQKVGELEYLRGLYDSEITPEMTILWKCMQLANFTTASLLLDNGLGSVDAQMLETGDTCLIKAIKEDVGTEASSCVNNEKDREEIIKFLLEDGDEWWADPEVKDWLGENAFDASKKLAERNKVVDYMKKYKKTIAENTERDSEL